MALRRRMPGRSSPRARGHRPQRRFRIADLATYIRYYGEHHAPELLAQARFVLPELAPSDWKQFPLIAAPGCYPTSVLLPLVPLLRDGVVSRRHNRGQCVQRRQRRRPQIG